MPIPSIPSLPSIAYCSHIPPQGFGKGVAAAGGGGGGGTPSVHVGSFTKATGAATVSQAITGLGFTPKVLMMWTVGATTSGTWIANFSQAMGMTTGASNSFSVATRDENNGGGTGHSETGIAAKALNFISFAGATVAECDLTSFDSDGFTLSWTTNDANAYIIHYLALGGAGITGAKILNWLPSLPSGTNYAATGAGFQPDCVFFVAPAQGWSAAVPSFAANGKLNIGTADKNGGQWAVAQASSSGGVPPNEKRWQRTDACVGFYDSISNAPTCLGSFVSMDADGFTVSFSPFSSMRTFALCLKGPSFKAGSFTKATGAAPASQAVTGAGFQPVGVLLASDAFASANTTAQTGMRLGIGATDGTNVQASTSQAMNAASPVTVHALSKTNVVCVKANNDTQTIEAEAGLTSLDSDGFTLSWTTNDAVATPILYWGVG